VMNARARPLSLKVKQDEECTLTSARPVAFQDSPCVPPRATIARFGGNRAEKAHADNSEDHMHDSIKARKRVVEMLRHFSEKSSSKAWHANLAYESAMLFVPEAVMLRELRRFAKLRFVELKSWSNAAGRELDIREFPITDGIFRNPDDGNHIRVRPLVRF
jgi:hypothetical protein